MVRIFCRGGWWWSRPYSGMLGSPDISRPYKWNSRAAGDTSRPYKWVRFVGAAHSPGAPGIFICRGGWWLSRPYKCPTYSKSPQNIYCRCSSLSLSVSFHPSAAPVLSLSGSHLLPRRDARGHLLPRCDARRARRLLPCSWPRWPCAKSTAPSPSATMALRISSACSTTAQICP